MDGVLSQHSIVIPVSVEAGNLEDHGKEELMSGRYDWGVAQQLHSVPFDALIFAAVLKADSRNLERLMVGFPELVAEANLHYHGRYEDEPAMTHIDQKRPFKRTTGIGKESNFTCACIDNYVCNYHVLLKAHEQSMQDGT